MPQLDPIEGEMERMIVVNEAELAMDAASEALTNMEATEDLTTTTPHPPLGPPPGHTAVDLEASDESESSDSDVDPGSEPGKILGVDMEDLIPCETENGSDIKNEMELQQRSGCMAEESKFWDLPSIEHLPDRKEKNLWNILLGNCLLH